MKKFTKALTALLLLSALLTGCAESDPEAPDDPSSPSGSTQELTEEQPTPVDRFDYRVSDSKTAVWITGYHGTSDQVVIPPEIDGKPVVTIANGAFSDQELQSVTIPDTVRVIGGESFSGNSKLRQVRFGAQSQLETIGTDAFSGCTALSKVDLSGTELTEIGNAAFSGCTGLAEILFCDTVTKIGKQAFSGCSSLKTLHLPAALREIEAEAFAYCSALETVTIPAGLALTAFDGSCFVKNPALRKIVFESGRDSIDGYGFFAIESDAEVIIPANVKRFEPMTFFLYGTVTMHFLGDCPAPANADSHGFNGNPIILYDPATNGWENCVWKDQYTVKPAPASPTANPASDFSYRETEDGGIRINWYLGTDPHVVIPDRIDQKPVVRIGSSAFTACAPVISVAMPDTVTVIEEKAFFGCNTLETITFSKSLAEIQAEAFAECDSLRHIRIPASVRTIGNMAFYNAWVETLEFEDGIRLETISYLSFSGTALKRLKLPDSVRTLEYGAFSNSHFLTEVELNEGLTSIGSGAFYGVDRLKEIVIPKTVTEVTEMEFDGCFALQAIYFDGNAPETFEYRNEISGLQKPSYGGLRLTIYYHEGATGFTPSLWYGYPTEIW